MSRLVKLEFLAELTGQVNGQPIEVYGEGAIVEQYGLTSGAYRLRKLPKELDPRFLGGCLVTGYPNACASSQCIQNPFGRSDYHYTRDLDFGQAGSLKLSVNCEHRDGRLHSKFELDGCLDVSSLNSIDEIRETWLQGSADNSVEGRFALTFRAPDGVISASCIASSVYQIERPAHEILSLVRGIDLKASLIDEEVLTLFQVSALSAESALSQ